MEATLENNVRNETGRSKSGRAGGRETAKRYGPDHFRRIGQLGGRARGRKNK